MGEKNLSNPRECSVNKRRLDIVSEKKNSVEMKMFSVKPFSGYADGILLFDITNHFRHISRLTQSSSTGGLCRPQPGSTGTRQCNGKRRKSMQ
ncbi:hypothetical protein CEXT_228141 [Caerostris extrusa]|uniref:Uncharacterized protein n=1 Tax=Caerostris extrusa TaxID=172846 RepID=A0AAV4TP98_CAEEX|nr:hypothetical protein CEXT_228141 [Caerostris extrusa]